MSKCAGQEDLGKGGSLLNFLDNFTLGAGVSSCMQTDVHTFMREGQLERPHTDAEFRPQRKPFKAKSSVFWRVKSPQNCIITGKCHVSEKKKVVKKNLGLDGADGGQYKCMDVSSLGMHQFSFSTADTNT